MTGIFIIARVGSTRLPHKHFLKTGGRMFIEWLVQRFETGFANEITNGEVKIFITTSVLPGNEKFQEIFKDTKTQVFFGEDESIPLRQLQCAEKFNIENIISVDGDDILCSPNAATEIWRSLKAGNEIAKTIGLPLGMNVFGYKTSFLKTAVDENQSQKLETGWGRIFEHKQIDEIRLGHFENDIRLRLTLDYDADAAFFKAVIEYFGEKIVLATDDEIIDAVIKNKFYSLNENMHDQYWNNFSKQLDQETKK